MATIRDHAEDYLAMRHKLGFKLRKTAAYVRSFVSFLEQRGMTTVTTDAAMVWATQQTRGTNPANWARRLMIIRIFARHLKLLEPATEVPPDDALPTREERITPYLFSPAELDALLTAAGRLRPAFRGLTYQTLFALLAVTGMRVGEACRLNRADVDLTAGVLTILDSKFGKSRQVPLHASTVAALTEYSRRGNEQPTASVSPAFLVSDRGTRLDPCNVAVPFGKLVRAVGIVAPPGRRRPRPHDLRHTFATATLLDWYRRGDDVQARLPLLSTYLGHAEPRSTYWYLSGSPELLAIAAHRLETSFGGRP